MEADAQNFWFAIISLTVAVASTVVNLFVVRSQIGLQLAELKSGIDESVIGWGEQAIEAVARAQFLAVRCQDAPDDDAFTNELRAHSEALSACVDHGRLFFPNEDPDSQGAERAGAFQGVRPPILDAMVFSCLMLGQLASLGPAERRARSSDAADFLNHCRRLVVTELQTLSIRATRRSCFSNSARGAETIRCPRKNWPSVWVCASTKLIPITRS